MRPPNIILVLCDDLGYSDIAPFGGRIATPSLSRMAEEGLIATSYYSPANICTPARAGILTGRYPVRTGLGFEVIMEGDDRALPKGEVTLAHALKPDYVSGFFGKWHLGHRAPDWSPLNYGFDRFFGIPYSHDMSGVSLFDAIDATSAHVLPVDFEALQERFLGEALAFMDAQIDRPFFVELALSAPYLPNYPPERLQGKSRAGPYGDAVIEIDEIVGRLLDHVRARGLAEQTLVIFTSDNGPWFEGSSLPLRDRKGGAGYDGGYRVPFVAWAPGRIPAGTRTDAILCGIDFLPTFCALAGLPLPEGIEIDGKDVSGLLMQGEASPHDEILLFNNHDVVAVRTQAWKLVDQTYYRGFKIAYSKFGYDELYDMAGDGTENYSLARYEPDVLADMKRRLMQARAIFKVYDTGVPAFFRDYAAKLKQRQD